MQEEYSDSHPLTHIDKSEKKKIIPERPPQNLGHFSVIGVNISLDATKAVLSDSPIPD